MSTQRVQQGVNKKSGAHQTLIAFVIFFSLYCGGERLIEVNNKNNNNNSSSSNTKKKVRARYETTAQIQRTEKKGIYASVDKWYIFYYTIQQAMGNNSVGIQGFLFYIVDCMACE